MEKSYPLPLSRDYVRHWGVTEAVRELIQNAIDSSADFEYATLDQDDCSHSLVLRSRGVTLDPSTLVLGVTSKADDDSKIGSFGEGYKIALLVLTRLGKYVKVWNGDLLWLPVFKHSDTFNAQLLHIVEEPISTGHGDLEFTIDGLTSDELAAITDSCLLMQPPMDDDIRVKQGRILPAKPGKLYVGGLFICDTDLEFGYDVLPGFIQLERDRQTVSSWDLKTLTRDMWMATGQHDRVAELIEADFPDVAYVEYGGATELVKEACYRLFQQKHPGGIAARTQKEMEALVAKGLINTVYVGGSFYGALQGSESYKAATTHLVAVATPQGELQAFLAQHSRRMQRLPKQAMRELIERAKGWRSA